MAKAGVKLIEVTGNSYQPLELISTLRDELPSCYIGAGTILSHDFFDKCDRIWNTVLFYSSF